MATGEHALVQRLPGGLCLAQFDRMDHPHSYGWHLYLRREFRVVRQREPRTRAAADRHQRYWKTHQIPEIDL